jgi:hypothetical protein
VKRSLRVIVLSSCTGLKAASPLLFARDFTRPMDQLESLLAKRESAAVPAEELYRGQHHVRLMRGIEEARMAPHLEVELRIVSAGFGLVRGTDKLVPYECTFQGMTRSDILHCAQTSGIPESVREVLAEEYALAVMLLGEDYLHACELSRSLKLGGPTLAFCSQSAALSLPPLVELRAIPLRTSDTRRFACGFVGLKGEVGARLLSFVAADPSRIEAVWSPDLLARLASVRTSRQRQLPVA